MSSVLTSDKAIDVNINIMRVFVATRKFIANNANLLQRVDNLEQKQIESDIKHIETHTKLDQVLDIIDRTPKAKN